MRVELTILRLTVARLNQLGHPVFYRDFVFPVLHITSLFAPRNELSKIDDVFFNTVCHLNFTYEKTLCSISSRLLT